MAKKKKASDPKDLKGLVDELVGDVSVDRDRLVKFVDNLISEYDGEKAVGIAEYVAKLTDALTRQHQVKAVVVKAMAKGSQDDEEMSVDDLQNEIGLPFDKTPAADDGSN